MTELWLFFSTYFLPPLLGALIGYATNYLALKMIFYPRRPWRLSKLIIPFTPGIFHKKRGELAKNIAQAFDDYILDEQFIRSFLHEKKIDQLVDGYVREKSLIASTIYRMNKFSVEEPIANLIVNFDFKSKIEEKINQMDSITVENYVFSFLKNEFKWITLLGGLIGFIIGLSQLLTKL